jgi:hypothetical protein
MVGCGQWKQMCIMSATAEWQAGQVWCMKGVCATLPVSTGMRGEHDTAAEPTQSVCGQSICAMYQGRVGVYVWASKCVMHV